jgi:hypothetical protein
VQDRFRRSTPHSTGNLHHVTDDSDFIVDRHDGHNARAIIIAQCLAHQRRIKCASWRHWKHPTTDVLNAMQHSMMFGR